MNPLARLCALLAAFGALNWVALGMFGKDAVTMTLGDERTVGTDGLRIVVGLAALYMVLAAFKSRKAG